MSKQELDSRELLAEVLFGLGHILGLPKSTLPVEPKILSRRWMVFQVPSATTPNYAHLVAGTVKDGWRCSCIGWQAHGDCYHVRAVSGALKLITGERKNSKRPTRDGKPPARGGGRGGPTKAPAAKRRGLSEQARYKRPPPV